MWYIQRTQTTHQNLKYSWIRTQITHTFPFMIYTLLQLSQVLSDTWSFSLSPDNVKLLVLHLTHKYFQLLYCHSKLTFFFRSTSTGWTLLSTWCCPWALFFLWTCPFTKAYRNFMGIWEARPAITRKGKNPVSSTWELLCSTILKKKKRKREMPDLLALLFWWSWPLAFVTLQGSFPTRWRCLLTPKTFRM